MGINASTAPFSGGNRPPSLEAGSYPGRVVQVIDLGLQNQRPWKGETKSPAREIMLTYEFADEFMLDEDGQEQTDRPRWLSESFPLHNLEADKAKSTLRYKALDPTGRHGGDFLKVLGYAVNITVVQNPNKKNPERPYENIAGITAMRVKDIEKAPKLVNKPVVFDLEEPDVEAFLSLPNWIQKRIMENLEFRGSLLEVLLETGVKEMAKDEEAIDVGETDEVPY